MQQGVKNAFYICLVFWSPKHEIVMSIISQCELHCVYYCLLLSLSQYQMEDANTNIPLPIKRK